QESFYRSRESIASPIVWPAPIRRDSPGWATRRLGEGRRTVGTRVSQLVDATDTTKPVATQRRGVPANRRAPRTDKEVPGNPWWGLGPLGGNFVSVSLPPGGFGPATRC